MFLAVWLAWRMGSRNRSRYRRPALKFLVGFPGGLTLLAMGWDLCRAAAAGGVSLRAILGSNLAVVLAYAGWTAIFLRIPRRGS